MGIAAINGGFQPLNASLQTSKVAYHSPFSLAMGVGTPMIMVVKALHLTIFWT